MGKIVRNNFDISPLNVVQIDGEGNYNVEQINNEDGTCILNITDAEQKEDWKEYYIHMIQRDTDTLIIPEGVIKLGSSIFFNWNNDTVGSGKGLKNISLPNSLMNIETNAFYQCSQLLLEHLPKNLTQISTQAFRSCSKITIKNLPSNITILKSSAFLNCSSLTNMTFDGDITIIEASVFNNCTNLNKFLFPNNTAVPTLSNVNAIPNGASFTGTIEVPSALLDTWKASTNWAQLTQANWIGI